jgi:hypothetical protein
MENNAYLSVQDNSSNMNRALFKGFLVLLILGIGLIGYYFYIAQTSPSFVYPVYPDTQLSFNVGGNWVFSSVQPVVKEFETTGKNTYLIGFVTDVNSKSREVKFLLPSDVAYFPKDSTTAEVLDFVSLSDVLTKGQQVSIFYLSDAPSKEVRNTAGCDQLGSLCDLAESYDMNKSLIKSFAASKDIENGLVLPVFVIKADLVATTVSDLEVVVQ